MNKFFVTLRITISSLGAVVCLLMCVWWVRSYSWVDGGHVKVCPWEYVAFHGGGGRMCVWFEHKSINRWSSWNTRPNDDHVSPNDPNRIPVFDLAFWPTFARLYIAHWLLAVVSAAIAVAPWCPRKFSLRGLMIATTVVAAIVGIILWIDHSI
jgi:hypothetical protein